MPDQASQDESQLTESRLADFHANPQLICEKCKDTGMKME